MIHKPQSSKLTRYARRHTSDAAKAKKAAKRQDEERARLIWLMTRQAIGDRDQWHCRVCGRQVKLHSVNPFSVMHAHHILYRSAGGTDDDLNGLICLCAECHDKEHRHVIDISGTSEALVVARDIHG